MANAQADADAACLRLINTNHANISFANASYPDVMLASRAEKRLLYQLVPEQLTEMCQTISDHLVANLNMPAADRDLAERVMDKYADQRTAHIPAIYLLSQRMYQVPARIGNDELLDMHSSCTRSRCTRSGSQLAKFSRRNKTRHYHE